MPQEVFTVIIAKIVGTTKEGVWAQVATLDSLQVVIALSDGGEGERGRQLLSFLEEEERGFKKKNLEELSSLVEKIKEKLSPAETLSLTLALRVGKVLYLASLGGAAFLKREERFEKIIEGEEKASGFLEDGDLLILGSQQFFQIIGPQTLSEGLNHFSPQEIAERLAPKISEVEDNAGCAALILTFQKEKEVWPEEEVEGQEPEETPSSAVAPSFFLNLLSQRLKSLGNKLRQIIPTPSLRLPSEERSGKEKKMLLTMTLLLLVLLGGSVFWGISRARQSEQEKKFTEFYQAATSKYEEGESLLDLNEVLARSRLEEAKEQAEKIKTTLTLNREQEKKIKELEEEIKEKFVTLSRVYKLEELPLFWETGLVKSESEGKALAIFGDQLAILDAKDRLTFLLSAKTKAVEILGADELKEEPKLLGLHGENIYLLTEKGTLKLSVKTKKAQQVTAKDEDWGELVSLWAYGGNFYLLDKGEGGENQLTFGQIWKYLDTGAGISAKNRYFASDIKPDFSQAKDMAIDGSIWVLLPGQILKFTRGQPESFTISGLEGDFGQPEVIFTNEASQNLYLLDPQNKKILVLRKDGVYKAQYLAEEISGAQDLAVSESEKKIFVLSGSKIYYVEIKE